MDTDVQSWRLLAETGLPVLLGTFVASAVLIVLLFPLLRRYALARPNARSSHVVPTPQGGGVAVVASALVVLAAAAGSGVLGAPQVPLQVALQSDPQIWAVAAGVVLLAVVGFIDDIRPIPPAPRLALQALAAALVVTALPAELRIADLLPGWAERLALVVGLVWFVNLVNFMDGIDWMSVAEMVPMAAALAVMAGLGALPPAAGLAALALLGAMLGFAPFNRPVARLFLGDVGSLPLGLASGWLLVLLAGRGHLAAAVLLPLYYVADATITLARRLGRGERVWEAHRTHFYQIALARGLSVPQVIGRVVATNVLLGALAVATVLRDGPLVDVVAVTIGGAVVALLLADLARPRPALGIPRRTS